MDTEIEGVLLSDNTGWQDDAVVDCNGTGFIVIGNSSVPRRENSLNEMRKTIDMNGALLIYYLAGDHAYYKAQAIDFALNQEEFDEKDWLKKYNNIAWYLDDFNKYCGNNSVFIVFLIDHFEKIKIPIYKKRFVLYSDYSYPVQHNMIPYIYVKPEKISSIRFNSNYFQFKKGFSIDFTYPLGHSEKAGKPLDKICIIGQSGTGKTTLIQIIKNHIKGTPINCNYFLATFEENSQSKPYFINIPTNSIENISLLDEDEILEFNENLNREYYDFEESNPKEHWYYILNETKVFQKLSIDFKLKLLKKIETDNKPENFINKINEEFKKWNLENKNPLKELGIFLKPLLDKFFLKIKDNPDKVENIKFIPIERKNDFDSEPIPNRYLSSGTKQILVKTVPFFYIKPENSVVLIDEPENSLYPDIQKDFVELLIKETWHEKKNCQFFFATHSPVIASSFEPWEIVELKFDDEGFVYQEQYYEGERHVDNYFKDARLLNYGDILTEIFDLKSDGREERIKALAKLAKLKKQLEKADLSEEKRTEVYAEFKRLAKLVNWNFEK